MKKSTRTSFAALVSLAALATALSAPIAWADGGHGGGDGGRRHDEHQAAAAPATAPVIDNDVNDDRGVDVVVVQAAPAAVLVDVDQHDLNDDINDDLD